MPAHGLYGNTRGVRYDFKEQEWLLKCDDCERYGRVRCYWPLVIDFWNPRSMQRCRTCNLERKRAIDRKARMDPAIRAKRNEDARRYFQANKGEAQRFKNRERQREWRARKKAEKEAARGSGA